MANNNNIGKVYKGLQHILIFKCPNPNALKLVSSRVLVVNSAVTPFHCK